MQNGNRPDNRVPQWGDGDDTYLPRDDRERKERQAELWTTSLTIAANHEEEFEELLAKRRGDGK